MPNTGAISKTKITVSLTSDAASTVEGLARKKGVSVSEIIRQAIALDKFVEEELGNGSTFLLRREDGETERIQFVFG